jgi:hypothetical protein
MCAVALSATLERVLAMVHPWTLMKRRQSKKTKTLTWECPECGSTATKPAVIDQATGKLVSGVALYCNGEGMGNNSHRRWEKLNAVTSRFSHWR